MSSSVSTFPLSWQVLLVATLMASMQCANGFLHTKSKNPLFIPSARSNIHARETTTTALFESSKANNSRKKQQDSESSPEWMTSSIEAKRPMLGHVVPKTSTTRQRKDIKPQGKFADDHPRKNKGAPPLKILGGTAKGRRLNSPLVHLRPMMGKVREAVFSTLTFMDLYRSPDGSRTKLCRHLDIFAGSGSVGLESLSRGATHCTFVDLAPNCCETIASNLDLCRFQGKADIICADALSVLRDPVTTMRSVGMACEDPPDPYQIVTICPPYEEVVYGDLIDAVANSDLVSDDTIVLLEYPIELGCLPHVYDLKSGGKMIGLRNRRYGRTVVALYIVNPTGNLQGAESRSEEFVSF